MTLPGATTDPLPSADGSAPTSGTGTAVPAHTDTAGPWFLRPGLWASDRFGTSSRLAILCAVLVVPGLAATYAFDSSQSERIRFTQTELAGLAVITPALEQMASAAQGRDVDLTAVAAEVAAHPDLDVGSSLRTAQAATAGAPDAVASTLALQDFITGVANASNLVLDPDLDSFYVMDGVTSSLPEALIASAKAARPLGGDRTAYDRAVEADDLADVADSLYADVTAARKATADASHLARLDTLTTTADVIRTTATAMKADMTDPAPVATEPVERAAAAAVAPLTSELRTLLDVRLRSLQDRRLITLVLTSVGDLIAVGFASATWWRSRHDVRLTVAAVTAIARGDLDDHLLPSGRDELGDIARALTTARQTLIDQRAQLHEAQLEREEQLRSGFAHQRDAERQTRERAQVLIDEAATTVLEELAGLMDQVEAVRRTAGVLEERVATAESVTRSVVDEAAAADRGALALGGSLREVGGMAAIIGGIAGQTKLLALNATIEAARAGSVGQGFTVVADEVKTLASSTAQSTERITTTLTALESDAAQVGAAITSVGSGIATLEDATSALAGVATEQRSVVAHLQSVLTTTIGRVEQLTTLSDQLERRRADRRPLSGTATLQISGRTVAVTLSDVSATGMRCVLEQPFPVRQGTLLQATLQVRGRQMAVQGSVVRGSEAAGATELGVEFVGLDAEARAVLASLLES